MTNMFSRKLTVLSLILILGFAPILSYADNDNGKKKGKKSDKSERVELKDDRDNHDSDDDDDFVNGVKLRGDGSVDDHDDNRIGDRREDWTEKKANQALAKSCRQVFKRLFGHGFLVSNSEIMILLECLRPFGINASFDGTASSTDSVPPTISGIVAKPNTIKATITWLTNEKSDSTVFWSASSSVDVNSSSTASVTRNEKVKEHKIVLENLSASTTYYFVVRSKDASGNTSTSAESSFLTKSQVTDNSAPIISSVTLLMGTSTANIAWHTNENATSKVYYGISSSLDVNATSTTFLENTAPKQTHLISLSNLATSTLYYFAAESKDASGNRTVTPVFSASTSGL